METASHTTQLILSGPHMGLRGDVHRSDSVSATVKGPILLPAVLVSALLWPTIATWMKGKLNALTRTLPRNVFYRK